MIFVVSHERQWNEQNFDFFFLYDTEVTDALFWGIHDSENDEKLAPELLVDK